jgi:hypothetical protein
VNQKPFRIYIGWDSREAECADVLAHSFRRHSSIPLDIKYLRLKELDFNRPWDPLQSTEFTYTRFLVPSLCAYRGIALFVDCDMLCMADVAELAELSMDGLALRVVKHNHVPIEKIKMDGKRQTTYPRKNWSSVMLMDCSKLLLWDKWTVENATGAYLHRFKDIDNELIGELPFGWNVLDRWRDGCKLLHYTSGGPWFEAYKDHPDGVLWTRELNLMRLGQETTLTV